MADLLHRFSGNPFATPVGQKIDQATDPSLTSENWALNIEICDLINETDDGARDAVRAIKKRLQQTAGKNFTVFVYTLTVLETCVKNCNKRFHILVTNRDFVQDLVKLIGPKNDPPPAIQEKVLSLIQSWAEAFHGQSDLQGVTIVYNELRNKGIEFPKSSIEPKVPIHTPHRSISSNPTEITAMDSPQTYAQSSSPPSQPSRPPTESYPIHLSPEQLNKMKSELEIVQGNMKVFSEMLTELKPGQEHKDDSDLLVELHGTCQTMQKRIVELIEKVANEEVTNELLRINDELNNLFMRFERYQKKRNNSSVPDSDMIPSTSSKVQASLPSSSKSKATNVPSLIDFTDDEPDGLSQKLNKVNITEQQSKSPAAPVDKKVQNVGDQEFDMFAQLRSTSVPSTSTSSEVPQPPQSLLPTDPVLQPATSSAKPQLKEKEMEEIEQWLDNESTANPSGDSSNMQFEQFLQRRSNVLEQQPLKKPTYNPDSSLI